MDWKRLAKRLILADGKITDREAGILREELWADHRITKDELEFLQELRREAQFHISETFDVMFFDIAGRIILADGYIADEEAGWLRNVVFAGDHTVTDGEIKFLRRLKRDATGYGDRFASLLAEVLHAPEFGR